MSRVAPAVLTAVIAALALAGCTQSSSNTVIEVISTGTECKLAAVEAPAGGVTFKVTNTSDAEAEFYVYDEAGTTIISEVEGIGPGLSRDLDVDLDAGTYTTACKSESGDEGIRAPFTVTE